MPAKKKFESKALQHAYDRFVTGDPRAGELL